MKVLLFLLLIIHTTANSQVRSFSMANVKDDQIQDLLIQNCGLKGIDIKSKEVRIWTGSTLTQLEINGMELIKAQVVKFNFSINNKEELKRCYFNSLVLSSAVANDLHVRFHEIDTIPSKEMISNWAVVLDGEYYGVETMFNDAKSVKSYYSLFTQEIPRIEILKTFFKYHETNVLSLLKLKLPPGEYVDLNRSLVFRVL